MQNGGETNPCRIRVTSQSELAGRRSYRHVLKEVNGWFLHQAARRIKLQFRCRWHSFYYRTLIVKLVIPRSRAFTSGARDLARSSAALGARDERGFNTSERSLLSV